jgi:precorrin-3B synthase
MTSFVVQGWCPGALRPMMSGDGLVVRVRPRMGRLTADQARGVARASKVHGNGLIDLSARANIQMRGVRPDSHLSLLDDLAALGLLDASEAVERHRNILLNPFWQGAHWQALHNAVAEVLADPEFSNLPGKFGVALDVDRPMVLQATSADIRLEASPEAWLLRPDGFTTGALVTTPAEAAQALRGILRWFQPRGIHQGRGRMAALAGQPLPPGFDHPMTGDEFHARPGPTPLGTLIGFEFGQLTAETLDALAISPVRTTPWRMILLEGQGAPDLPGLILDPRDPRLNVTACTGAPGCPQGLQPTRDLARSLAPHVPPGQHLHVSGCAKGCAHPAPCAMTLSASAQGFTLVRNGCAGDPGQPFTSLSDAP